MELFAPDIRYVVQRLPKDVREILTRYPKQVFVGGGFIRATIAGETPSDIDIFGDDLERLQLIAKDLKDKRPGSKIHTTKNAITLITPNRLPVQFITRWLFKRPEDLVKSFDFTVCQAAVWRDGNQNNDKWMTSVSERFYIDLASRRLVYTNPVREEEAGGSMLRVLKYVKRGYSIQVGSLGDVIGRLTDAVDVKQLNKTHLSKSEILVGLLREVDPLLVIDGFDVEDDHEPVEGEA